MDEEAPPDNLKRGCAKLEDHISRECGQGLAVREKPPARRGRDMARRAGAGARIGSGCQPKITSCGSQGFQKLVTVVVSLRKQTDFAVRPSQRIITVKGSAMPIRQMLEVAGVSKPEEIALLTRVFEATCPKFENVSDREQRASRIILNFQNGMRDEAELVELARQPLGR